MRQKIQWVLGLVGLISILLIGNVFVLKSAIVEQAGLAVAASLNKWNPVQDAIVGDGLQSGVLANGLFAWTGTAFNRLRMDGSNNLLMNLNTAIPTGTNSVGNVGLNAGTNSIGTVGLNAGTNSIGNIGTITTNGSYSVSNIKTNATTVVKNAAGVLHTIAINNPGATWSVQICNNASSCSSGVVGTIVPTVTTTLLYDISLGTGITIVTSGTTPGDITVSFN